MSEEGRERCRVMVRGRQSDERREDGRKGKKVVSQPVSCLSKKRERDRLTSSMASWSWVNLSMSLREERDECQLGGSGSSGGRPYVESSAETDDWSQHV